MVDVRLFVRQQDLGDWHDLIALAEQVVEDIRQCLWRVLAALWKSTMEPFVTFPVTRLVISLAEMPFQSSESTSHTA